MESKGRQREKGRVGYQENKSREKKILQKEEAPGAGSREREMSRRQKRSDKRNTENRQNRQIVKSGGVRKKG